MHDPEQADAVAEGRRLGGLRRKRSVTLAAAYELGDIGEVDGIRRFLEITLEEGLALENGVARLRVLIAGVRAATELLRVADLEARISALERHQAVRVVAHEPLTGLLGELRGSGDEEGGDER